VVAVSLKKETVDGEMSDRDLRLKTKNIETLRGFTEITGRTAAKRVHFAFLANPIEVLGTDRVTVLRLELTEVVDGRARGTGSFFEIDCGLVLPAIGYRSAPIEGAPFNDDAGLIDNDDGRVEPGLYVVGWIKRGPTGVIATNRPDGKEAAALIDADFPDGGKPGRTALEAALGEKGVNWVSFADWQKIDAAEVAAAPDGAPRRKFTTVADMLAVLD
jgi:ferredoxin--NADP+ reductase